MTELQVRLGKKEYQHDPRTLMMARYVLPEIRVPARWDFDKGRIALPNRIWGNGEWGDCVIAGECNHIVRLERIEQRRTILLNDQDAIERYKKLTGSSTPGDAKDEGLVILDAMRNWQHVGFDTTTLDAGGNRRNYTIAAYGELEPNDRKQLRMASYAMHGIHLGFWLPRAAQQMTNEGVWHYEGQTGPEWQPGSWGGHLVYSKAFDPASLEVITWAMKVKVTNEFIEKYADEAWAVVDNFDTWRTSQTINVSKLTRELGQISSKVNQ